MDAGLHLELTLNEAEMLINSSKSSQEAADSGKLKEIQVEFRNKKTAVETQWGEF
jgi:hypothetical protein